MVKLSSVFEQMLPAKRAAKPPAPVWDGKEYPRHLPGERLVRGVSFQGPEWCNLYRRWSIRVEFALTDEPGVVSQFFNMGNDREKTQVGRMSKYFRAWSIANGEPPKRGEELSPSVFMGQLFRVRLKDCSKNSEGIDKSAELVYSVVEQLIERIIP
jgi:hypothetical protein